MTDPVCALYCRYDGPIPHAQLNRVRADTHPGGPRAQQTQQVRARARQFDALACGAVRAMAHRRAASLGTLPRDLMFYRAESLRLLGALGR